MKRAAIFTILGVSVAALGGYNYLLNGNRTLLSVDLCASSSTTVSVSVDSNFSLPVERAALFLEMKRQDGEIIHTLFGLLELDQQSGFVFEVPADICFMTRSVRASIEYELPMAAQFDRDAQAKLIENTKAVVVPSNVSIQPVEQFRI